MAFAEDRYAYISDMQPGNGWSGPYLQVTVTARPGAFEEFPYGFDAIVRPHRNALQYVLGTIYGDKNTDIRVNLTPNNPSVTVTYSCSGYVRENACDLKDFIVITQR